MNDSNIGKQFITYTILVMDEGYFDLAMRLLRYLVVVKGHRVNFMFGKEGHDGMESSIRASDVIVVFSKQCNTYAKSIAELVRPITGTFSILVTDEVEKEFNDFNFTYLESDFSESGYVVHAKTHECFCNLCAMIKLAKYHPYS